MRRTILAACAVLFAICGAMSPTTAQARWLKAETEHFVLYSDGSEQKLRALAAKLVAFDHMLRTLHAVPSQKARGKLDIYLVWNNAAFRRALPGAGEALRGVYRAHPEGVHVIAIRAEDPWMDADDVLFHEYAHHFMLENFPGSYPPWIVEGYAEFFSTARVKPDTIEVGHPPPGRAAWLLHEAWIPYNYVLTARMNTRTRQNFGLFYSQSWVLTHYLMSDPARARQLNEALARISAGEQPVDAVTAALSLSPEQLGAVLRRYIRGSLTVRKAPNPVGASPPVAVSELPASADDFLLESLALRNDLNDIQKGALLRQVRGRAERYRGDALAELTLARAELQHGDSAAGLEIIERRLTAAPRDAETLRTLALARLAAGRKDEEGRAALFGEARGLLARANAAAPNDYRTLIAYAEARSVEADYPNLNTVEVLLLANELAPSVGAIRLRAGAALIKHGHYAHAEEMLQPLANNPHGGREQSEAVKLLLKAREAQGKAGPEGDAPDGETSDEQATR